MSDATSLPATGRPADPTAAFLDLKGHHHPENGSLLGFWIYLMSDLLIFACLFATFGVLGRSYAAGPSGAELFDLKLVAVNTALLLFSSLTYGLAMIAMQAGSKRGVLGWLALTGLLGAGAVALAGAVRAGNLAIDLVGQVFQFLPGPPQGRRLVAQDAAGRALHALAHLAEPLAGAS